MERQMNLQTLITICATAFQTHMIMWDQVNRLKNAITQLSGD
ncbi:MAG: hypothetical protein ACJAZW_000206 [Maritalea sp.]|jgi:hypothetical protein